MKNQSLLLFLLFLFCGISHISAQEYGYTLRGTVLDQVTQRPLPFVNVILSDSLVVSTNDEGVYRFENISIGKYKLAFSFIGYEDVYLNTVFVDAGKTSVIDVTMNESAHNLGEIVISADLEKAKPLNEMALVSTRMVSVEETKRYAASFNDPARMANSFAGVVQVDAGNNDLSVRGNSPNGMLWRLEGIDIPNPNHFSQVGTSGGGVSILSGQLLANSDFSTGAFTAEYGNALSGVFDIKLRKGNNEEREYTIQLGVLGLDLAVEGPFSKNSKSSYLVNYRYSTLGILSRYLDFGGFVTTFQDLSYNVNFKNKKWGDISIFGLNGLSSQVGYDSIYEYDLDFEANTLVNGITHSKSIGNNSFLKTGLVYSSTLNGINSVESDTADISRTFVGYNEKHKQNKITFSSKFQHKVNRSTSLKAGVIQSWLSFDVFKKSQQSYSEPSELIFNQSGSTSTTQLYAQIQQKYSSKFVANYGVHFLHSHLNGSKSIEPRLAFQYAMHPKHSLSVGYGLHSQIIPLAIHFVEIEKETGITYPNKELSLGKAHHLVTGYNFRPSSIFNVKIEAYYQSLFNVPHERFFKEHYSLINLDNGTPEIELDNTGRGRNYGVELTLEKYLSHGFYFTSAASLYEAKYKGSDDQWYDTRYNGNFTTSLTAGKEFTISKKKNRIMGIHIKTIYAGGLRQNSIDLQASIEQDETVYDTSTPFSSKVDDFFRFDLKLIFKRNFAKTTSSLVFDLQNITNRENAAPDSFNSRKMRIEKGSQLGLLPSISYKLEF